MYKTESDESSEFKPATDTVQSNENVVKNCKDELAELLESTKPKLPFKIEKG